MDPVAEAMTAVPRVLFLPHEERRRAAADEPVGIGYGQTNSQPSTVATMLRLLDLAPGQRVLDVGAGSGWTTALLARLVGRTGRVLGLELEPALVRFGVHNLARTGQPWARIEPADPDVLGRPEEGPFDRILVSAMGGELPDALVGQLPVGGILVLPVAGRLLRFLRTSTGSSVTDHGAYSFVPLR